MSSDLMDGVPQWNPLVKVQCQNGKTVKQMAKVSVCDVSGATSQSRSRERFKTFMISGITSYQAACRSKSTKPGRIQEHSAASNF